MGGWQKPTEIHLTGFGKLERIDCLESTAARKRSIGGLKKANMLQTMKRRSFHLTSRRLSGDQPAGLGQISSLPILKSAHWRKKNPRLCNPLASSQRRTSSSRKATEFLATPVLPPMRRIRAHAFAVRSRTKSGLLRNPQNLVRLQTQPPLWMIQTILQRQFRIRRAARPIHRLQKRNSGIANLQTSPAPHPPAGKQASTHPRIAAPAPLPPLD